ncbi:MAG: hypothetical protein KJ737_06740 [Proteobacteria bacterium]|nr:hypothetical protein [Pseudomonadota bacterium]
MEQEKVSFSTYLDTRKSQDELGFFSHPAIQKAYYIGGYAKAVIMSSYKSEVSNKNQTFKNWLSNQIINYRNLDRIFEMAFRFEQKLKLRLRNDSEVRSLAHETPITKSPGMSSSRISFSFVAGFDDYGHFVADHKTEEKAEQKEKP